MARFHDKVGYELPGTRVGGVYKANVVERDHTGDILKAVRSLEPSDKVNDNIRLQNRIEIMADAYALENFAFIKYVSWNGVRWTVTSVEVQRPRLILDLGGVYNGTGPTP